MKAICGIASALEHLHWAGVVHFDLGPGDVLFNDALEVCISDFNRSREVNARATFDWDCDIAYKAPELLPGKEIVATEAVDIYALGMLMALILTGRPPFQEAGDLRQRILEGAAPNIGDCGNPLLRELVLECIATNDAQRPKAEAIVAKLTGDPRYLLGNVNANAFHEYVAKLKKLPVPVAPRPPKAPRSANHNAPRSIIAKRGAPVVEQQSAGNILRAAPTRPGAATATASRPVLSSVLSRRVPTKGSGPLIKPLVTTKHSK
jgi:serine/threonine protein kinase